MVQKFVSVIGILCLCQIITNLVQAASSGQKNGMQLTLLDQLVGSDYNLFPEESQLNLQSKFAKNSWDQLVHLKNVLQDPKIGVQSVYGSYLEIYGKDPSRADDGVHSQVFQSNLMMIAEHNLKAEQGQSTYTMGVNQFTDMTNSEASSYLGHSVNPSNTSNDLYMEMETLGQLKAVDSSKDWRQGGYVTKIKNQENCGSCVTFATVAAVESQYAINKGQKNVDYSPQELVDCTSIGCSGGDWPEAFDYMKNGVSTEAQYPYAKKKGPSCKASSTNRRNGAKVSSWGYLSRSSGGEGKMRDYIGQYGPIVVGVAVSRDFQYYKKGVFTGPCTGSVNHAVTCIGYGDDGGKNWIIKNQWGTGWGEEGYMRLAREKNTCKVSTDAAYVKV